MASLTDLSMGGAADLLTFRVQVHFPRLVDVQYTWNGSEVRCKMFCCLLSGESGDYCMGEVKPSKKQPKVAEEALKKYTSSSVLELSRVKLADSKLAYVHTPIKKVVNLQATKVNVVKEKPDKTWFPKPRIQVAECLSLQTTQQFDVMGFVTKVEELKTIGSGRRVCEIVIEDGSKNMEKHVAMTVSMWFDAGEHDPQELLLVKEGLAKRKPLCFYALAGKHDSGNGYVVQSSRNMLVTEAPPDTQLPIDFETLAACVPENKQTMAPDLVLQDDTQSYKQDPAVNTTVSLLERVTRENDSLKGVLWQLNWCELTVAKADYVSKTGRIWFLCSLRDMTGSTECWIRELAALELMGGCTRSEFLEAVQDGKALSLPLLSSVRVLSRSTSDLVIVEAAAQRLTELLSFGDLLPFLRACAASTSQVTPSLLENVQSSSIYNLACVVGSEAVGCQRALCLITSHKQSKLTQVANGAGYVVLTEMIQCGLNPSGHYKCKAICNLDDTLSMRLDPPRPGATQYALLSISGRSEDTFLINARQLVREEEAQ
ncbi:unnamed protein product, partial [Durusdinium trenchii]